LAFVSYSALSAAASSRSFDAVPRCSRLPPIFLSSAPAIRAGPRFHRMIANTTSSASAPQPPGVIPHARRAMWCTAPPATSLCAELIFSEWTTSAMTQSLRDGFASLGNRDFPTCQLGDDVLRRLDGQGFDLCQRRPARGIELRRRGVGRRVE